MSKPVEVLHELTNDKYDPNLGSAIHQHLVAKGMESPYDLEQYNPRRAFERIQADMGDAMKHLGLDLSNDSLKDTPARFARMFVGELTRGLCYDLFPKCTTVPAESEDMVVVRDLSLISLCEHHFQTIDGVCHIAYIPKRKWLGLSKFGRVVDFFCRRPQVQERLTLQIHEALCCILDVQDVAVIVDAKHYCMKARGVMQHASYTQTNRMGGLFFNNPPLRGELMDALRQA